VRKNHRPLGAALVAREAQTHTVDRLEKRHLRRPHAEWTFGPRWDVGVEHARPREHIRVSVQKRP